MNWLVGKKNGGCYSYYYFTQSKITVFTKIGNSTNLFHITMLQSSGITNYLHHLPHTFFLLCTGMKVKRGRRD